MGKILKGIIILLGIVLLIGIFGGSSNNADPSYKAPAETQTVGSSASQAEASAPAATEAEQTTIYAIGDRVVSGNIAYTVTNVATSPTLSNEYSSTSADGIFVIVDMDLENVGKETFTMTSGNVKLMDDQGRIFESDTDSWMYIDTDDNILLKQLQPGLKTSGQAIYDVPTGGGYGALVSGSLWGGDEQLIALGKT